MLHERLENEKLGFTWILPDRFWAFLVKELLIHLLEE